MAKTVTTGKQVRRARAGNSLAERAPRLLALWDARANGDLDPTTLAYSSGHVVSWRCSCGEAWQRSTILQYKRALRGFFCPTCPRQEPMVDTALKRNRGRPAGTGDPANSLTARAPHLVALWDQELNGSCELEKVSVSARECYAWSCRCGARWQATARAMSERDPRYACKDCAPPRAFELKGEPLTVSHPELAAQWHPTLNGHMLLESAGQSSSRLVWWSCDRDATHRPYRATPSNRTRHGSGCPHCFGSSSWSLRSLSDRVALAPDTLGHEEWIELLQQDGVQYSIGQARAVYDALVDGAITVTDLRAWANKRPSACDPLIASFTRGNYGRRQIISRSLRARIYEIAGHRCQNPACTTPDGKLHLDHRHPLSRGGLDNRTNLQVLCASCNSRKKVQPWTSFLRDEGVPETQVLGVCLRGLRDSLRVMPEQAR